MILSAHQPNLLPWLGFFLKIYQSDVFVFSDDVKYSKQQYVNRSKFKARDGSDFYLTLPIAKSEENRINKKFISRDDIRVFFKGLRKIEVEYATCLYYKDVNYLIEKINESLFKHDLLADFNIDLIKIICSMLSLNTNFKRGSDFGLDAFASNERIYQRAQILGINTYLCGHGASSYQDDEWLKKSGVDIRYVDYDQISQFESDGGYSIVHVIANYGIKNISTIFNS